MVELDGETVYACTARLDPRPMRLALLSNKHWCATSSPKLPRPASA
jgi:hypothetical protein